MIVITHNDIYNTSGGLERAAKTFITWIERSGAPVNYFSEGLGMISVGI